MPDQILSMKDVLIVIAVFLGFWFLWIITGGVERFENSNRGVFIKPLPPVGSGKTYGDIPPLPTYLQHGTTTN